MSAPDHEELRSDAKLGLTIPTGILIALAAVVFNGVHTNRNILLPSAIASSKLVINEVSEFDEAIIEEPKVLPLTGVTALPFPEPPPPPMAPWPLAASEPEKTPTDSQPGGSPMTTNSSVTLKIVLAGWFFGLPSLSKAADPEKPPSPGQTADRIQQMNRTIEDINTKLKGIEESLKALPKLQEDLDKDSQAIQRNIDDIRAIREEISKMRQDIAKLQTDRRILPYPPNSPATPANKIQIVNGWMEPVTVIIDNASYRLAPGQAEMVDKTTTFFDYEVLGVQPLKRINFIKPGETFSIRIGPR